MVLDLESGAVVFVGDGKGAKALNPFWKRLKGGNAKIEAMAMDMSPAYREAVSTNLPKAKIVFDRFHVWLLLKAAENLDETDGSRSAREIRMNPEAARAGQGRGGRPGPF